MVVLASRMLRAVGRKRGLGPDAGKLVPCPDGQRWCHPLSSWRWSQSSSRGRRGGGPTGSRIQPGSRPRSVHGASAQVGHGPEQARDCDRPTVVGPGLSAGASARQPWGVRSGRPGGGAPDSCSWNQKPALPSSAVLRVPAVPLPETHPEARPRGTVCLQALGGNTAPQTGMSCRQEELLLCR